MPKGLSNLDPDKLYTKAEENISISSPEERLAWYNHPCTQALIQSLQGDEISLYQSWLSGAGSNPDSADAAAQYVAYYRGCIRSIQDVLDKTEEIKVGDLNEN